MDFWAHQKTAYDPTRVVGPQQKERYKNKLYIALELKSTKKPGPTVDDAYVARRIWTSSAVGSHPCLRIGRHTWRPQLSVSPKFAKKLSQGKRQKQKGTEEGKQKIKELNKRGQGQREKS